MKNLLIIGGKPYQKLVLTDLLDLFGDPMRFNISLPGMNNGSKYGWLALCNHLWKSLIEDKVTKEEFHSSYLGHYHKEYLDIYINRFFEDGEKDYFIDILQVLPRRKYYNLLLKKYKSNLSFTALPGSGISMIFECLLNGYFPYISNFRIFEESRKSLYVETQEGQPSEVHNYKEEIQIIQWLHRNKYIDASLCLLDDMNQPCFISRNNLKPTKKVYSIVHGLYGSAEISF